MILESRNQITKIGDFYLEKFLMINNFLSSPTDTQ